MKKNVFRILVAIVALSLCIPLAGALQSDHPSALQSDHPSTLQSVLRILFFPSAGAETVHVKLDPIGKSEEILPKIAVYCDKWHDSVGKSLGFDMDFDESNLRQTQEKHFDMGGNQVTTFDMDGVEIEIDDERTIYSVTVIIPDDSKAKYAAYARIFALKEALTRDYPASPDGMTTRFLDDLTAYTDFMEANKAQIAAGEITYWRIPDENGEELEFQFYPLSNGRLMMIFDKLYFDY